MDPFATTSDLTGWLPAGVTVDADDAGRLLDRATEVVAEHVSTGYYVDPDGNPVDSEVVDALRKAACAQIEQWLEVGEDNDVAGYPRGSGMSVGGVNISALPSILAPRARRILGLAGLMNAVAY